MNDLHSLTRKISSDTLHLKRVALNFLGIQSAGPEAGQQAPQYYNTSFSTNPGWRRPYTESPYYFLWTVIIDRLRWTPATDILEIGCGPGQLAGAMNAAGVFTRYTGIDFSEVAIDIAKEKNPGLRFVLDDAVTTELYETEHYDTVVTTEFLEHVEEDLHVIDRLRPDTRLLGTVPNFPYVSHVRHFDDADQVAQRYAENFRDFSVAAIPGVQPDTQFYLLDGIKT